MVSHSDIVELVGKAFPKAFTASNIHNGPQVIGICINNENMFEEHEILSAFVTDRSLSKSNKSLEQVDNEQQDREQSKIAMGIDEFTSSESSSFQAGTAGYSITPTNAKTLSKGTCSKKEPRRKSRILTDTTEKQEIKARMQGKPIKMSSERVQVVTDYISFQEIC